MSTAAIDPITEQITDFFDLDEPTYYEALRFLKAQMDESLLPMDSPILRDRLAKWAEVFVLNLQKNLEHSVYRGELSRQNANVFLLMLVRTAVTSADFQVVAQRIVDNADLRDLHNAGK